MGVPHLSRARNAFNCFLLLISPLPAFYLYYRFLNDCPVPDGSSPLSGLPEFDFAQPLWPQFCHIGLYYPAVFQHFLLFLNFDVFLWILQLLQNNNSWLVDPWWTLLPPSLAYFWYSHPLAHFDSGRSLLSWIVLLMWSIRLTHSYFRREEYQFGAREDWRFTEMRQQYTPIIGELGWTLGSFFIVYFSQHFFLFGITLPMYSIHFDSSAQPLCLWDLLLFLGCLAGMKIAYLADTQLRAYMVKKESDPSSVPLVLKTGVWRYSRHPNYFGEIFFWSCFGGWALLTGNPAYLWGTGLNTLCLFIVSFMVEKRMKGRSERLAAFQQYQRETSRIIPWWPSIEREKLN